jgi:hypothetical protein
VSLLFDFGVGTAILTGWLSFCYPSNNFLVHPFWRGVPKTPPNLLYFTVIPKDLLAIALEIVANDKSENFRCSALFCRPQSRRDVQKKLNGGVIKICCVNFYHPPYFSTEASVERSNAITLKTLLRDSHQKFTRVIIN